MLCHFVRLLNATFKRKYMALFSLLCVPIMCATEEFLAHKGIHSAAPSLSPSPPAQQTGKTPLRSHSMIQVEIFAAIKNYIIVMNYT